MHFSIPDTQDVSEGGSTYTVFNLHINGVYHCSLRYRQLHSFHEQLKKEYGAQLLPNFPPKKLLSLTAIQLEERRLLLERYIQIVSQNQQIAASDTFNGFLLSAQQSSQQEKPEDVTLDAYLMNGHKITVNILSTDQTDDVLESVASQIQLADDFVYYFGLFLIKKEEGSDNAIVRKLQEFESPFISLKAANQNAVHRIVLRKSYWDPAFDDDLLEDRIAMNLIYVQAVNDIERGWVSASKDQLRQLASLQQRGSKKEYLRLARTLKCYGFLQFKPCTTDIPSPGSPVHIAAGNRDLSFRINTGADELMERSFKVTRMRCWRITTTMPEVNGEASLTAAPTKLELAFEYLVAKDTLKWITICSDQAILLSMCLQGMVDELIMKKQNRRIKRPSDRSRTSNGGQAQSPITRSLTGSSLKSPSSPSEMISRSISLPAGNQYVTLRPLQLSSLQLGVETSSQLSLSTASHLSDDAYATPVIAILPNNMVYQISSNIQDDASSTFSSGSSLYSDRFATGVGDIDSLDGSSLSLTTSVDHLSRDLFTAPVEREESDTLRMAGNVPWDTSADSSGCMPVLQGTAGPSDSIPLPHQNRSRIARGGDGTTSTRSRTASRSSRVSLGSPAQEIRDICRRALDSRLKDVATVQAVTDITDSHEPEVLQNLYRLEKKVDCVEEKLNRLLRHLGVAGAAETDRVILSSDGRHVMMEDEQFDYDTSDDCSLASYVTV